MNTHPVPLVLAALGAIAGLANGGVIDAALGAMLWFLIGLGIMWVVLKVRSGARQTS